MIYPLIELACNQALEHDAAALASLQTLQGKSLLLEIKQVNQRLSIEPHAHGVEITTTELEHFDVTLSATPSALLSIAKQGLEGAELAPGELEISGDPIIAQRFARIAANLNIDWEGLLAEHFGELPSVILSKGFKQASVIANDGKTLLKDQLNTLLKEKFELVADHHEVDIFLENVDDLRATVDRLEARVKRIREHF